jgi:hypothetical protein
MVATLRVYAPALLTSKSASLVDAVARTLDRAETPRLGETQLVCRDLADELEVGGHNLTSCANQARYVVEGQDLGYVSGWRQGQALQIASSIPGVPAPATPVAGAIFGGR